MINVTWKKALKRVSESLPLVRGAQRRQYRRSSTPTLVTQWRILERDGRKLFSSMGLRDWRAVKESGREAL